MLFITPLLWLIGNSVTWDASRTGAWCPVKCRTVVIATHDVVRAVNVRNTLTSHLPPDTNVLIVDKQRVFREREWKDAHTRGRLVVVTLDGDDDGYLKGDYHVIDALRTNTI